MEELYQVGAITQTHGIKGEVKVFPMTDDIGRFKNMKNLILKTKQEELFLDVVSVKQQKNMAILKFKGYDDINQVERFKGCGLYVTKENRVACQEDEYFVADLIGVQVVDEKDQMLGTLTDVIETGANDVYVVTKEDGKELLLPAIKECILQVFVEDKKMKIHLLDGLE